MKITEWLFEGNLKKNLKAAELGDKIAKFSGSKNWQGKSTVSCLCIGVHRYLVQMSILMYISAI